MRHISKIIFTIMISAVFAINPLRCFAEASGDAAELIEKAIVYMEEDNKESAISALDAAFGSADSAGDYDALMKIGDLYLAIDTSLGDKAMNAWTAAGRAKCQ